MRWKEDSRGARVITRFLFFPLKLGGETRWLEWADIIQYRYNAKSGRRLWSNERWYDKG